MQQKIKEDELFMPENWKARLIAKLHMNRISKKRLAEQLGYTPEYVSMVLNGHRSPNGAENEFSKALGTNYLSSRSKERPLLALPAPKAVRKKGCPTGDKSISHIFNIAITPPDVKWSGNNIYRLIQSMAAARISGESIVCILQNLFRALT